MIFRLVIICKSVDEARKYAEEREVELFNLTARMSLSGIENVVAHTCLKNSDVLKRWKRSIDAWSEGGLFHYQVDYSTI